MHAWTASSATAILFNTPLEALHCVKVIIFQFDFCFRKKDEIAQRQIWLVQLVANEDCVFFSHKTLGHCGTVAQKFRFFLQYFLPQLTQDITVELCTVSVIPGAEIMAHNLVNVERREKHAPGPAPAFGPRKCELFNRKLPESRLSSPSDDTT